MCPSHDSPSAPEGDKLAILVVDDEPTLRLGFAYALSNKTTTVDTANNGRQALERIAEKPFDLMILDLRMPELDGIGVLDALSEQGNELPVILCSAAAGPEAALRAIRHGVVDILLKPVRPLDLRQAVGTVLRPNRDTASRAAVAMRRRRFDEALAILETEDDPPPRSACWQKLLRAMRDGEDDASLETMLLRCLPEISLNPPLPS